MEHTVLMLHKMQLNSN